MGKGGKVSGFSRHKNAEKTEKPVKYAWRGDSQSTQGVRVAVREAGNGYYKVKVRKQSGGRWRTLDNKKYKPLEKARKRAVKHLRSY